MYSIHVKIHGVLKPENNALMEDLKRQIYTSKFQRGMVEDEVVTKCTANINQIDDWFPLYIPEHKIIQV